MKNIKIFGKFAQKKHRSLILFARAGSAGAAISLDTRPKTIPNKKTVYIRRTKYVTLNTKD